MRNLIGVLVTKCCEGDAEPGDLDDALHETPCCAPGQRAINTRSNAMVDHVDRRQFNVLFLCTGNSARSIMAEALLNRAGRGEFRAHSAGSVPKGDVHPYTLDLLRKLKFDVTGLRSKSWSEFARPDTPKLDFVFTVCDNAANETCPVWPGQPMTAHWAVPDPAAATGNEAEVRLAFAEAMRWLSNRINTFVSLPLRSLDTLSLQRQLDSIGKTRDKGEAPATAAE